MPDPVHSHQTSLLLAKNRVPDLTSLLQSGAKTGTVKSSNPQKTVLQFDGKNYTLQLKGQTLPQHATIQAQLIKGQIALQILGQSSDVSAQSSRSLSTMLQEMGFTGEKAEVLAQALLKAGIPLDRTVLRDLLAALPELNPNTAGTLSFLLAKGLAINPSLLWYFSQILKPKPPLSENAGKVKTNSKRLQSLLEEDEHIPEKIKEKVREINQQFNNQEEADEQDSPPNPEELEQLFREFLATPEHHISQENQQAYASAVVQLLSILTELQSYYQDTEHAPWLHDFWVTTEELHQSLIAQVVNNIPSQTEESAPPLFVEIPYHDGDQEKTCELLYTPSKDDESGHVDLRLELTHLGAMHIHLQWNHPQLRVTLLVENENIRDFLQSVVDELQHDLQEKGFQVLSIKTQLGEVPTTLQNDDLNNNSSDYAGLDIRA